MQKGYTISTASDVPSKSYHSLKRNFVALLKACCKQNDREQGRNVHAEIARCGMVKTDVFTGSALVDMYFKCGLIAEAQEVFDTLRVTNVVTWNALIGGYAQHERGQEALCCLDRMKEQGISPNVITYTCGFKACGSVHALEKGSALHDDMQKEGLLLDTFVVTALVDMYAKCGSLAKAQEVFDALPVHDVEIWNALISGYALNERGDEALTCFDRMQFEGLSPNAITMACGLRACGLVRAGDKGEEIIAELARNGQLTVDPFLGSAAVDMYTKCGLLVRAQEVFDILPYRNVVTWNALIAGYTQHNCGETALFLFDQMQDEGVSPNTVSYTCSLNACGSIGATDKGSYIYADVSRKGLLDTDLSVGSALIDMYAKCGALAEAQGIFENLSICNIVTWNALITGYAQLGEIERVLCLFDEMVEGSKVPQAITFVSVLSACSHAGLVDEGLRCFQMMSYDYNILTNVSHQNCMIDLLGRAGQLDGAMALVVEGPVHPTLEMWLTVLGACKKWGFVDLGSQAFEHAVQVNDTDNAAFFCMYNIYADASLLENAKKVEALRVNQKA